MSDESDDKTEQASEKKLADLRKEGKVAQSSDMIAAATMMAVCAALASSLDTITRDVTGLTLRVFRLVDAKEPTIALKAAVGALWGFVPVMAVGFVAAVVAGLAQTRGLFSFDLLMPKLERLDPMSKLKQLMPGKDMAMEMGKSLLKIGVIGLLVKNLLEGAMPRLMMLGNNDARVSAGEVSSIAAQLIIWASAAFAVVAAIDYFIALRKFEGDTKMSKQEQKEEFKQEEADPGLKHKMRRRAKEMMAQRAQGGIETATVLVTNPTHFAVALRYDPERDAAPMIVGKAVEDAALALRKRARKLSIPIVENRPLARSLHKNGKVGKPVPVDLYRAVAEVIAHVMRLRAGVSG